ncbi:MAG: hypothetical protein ACREDR_08805, partial [Blastocatellia bacterium]
RVDLEALCRARRRIEEIVARERLLKRRIGGKQKISRFLNIVQPKYDLETTPATEASTPAAPSTLKEPASTEHRTPDIAEREAPHKQMEISAESTGKSRDQSPGSTDDGDRMNERSLRIHSARELPRRSAPASPA